MKIDFEILEVIRQYLAGTLSATEMKETEKKIQSEKRYRDHYRMLVSTDKAIRNSLLKDHGIGPTSSDSSDSVNIKALLQKDHTATRYRIGRVVIASAAIITLLLIGWNQYHEFQNNSEPPIVVDDQKSEEEIAIGSTGDEIVKEIPLLIYASTTQLEPNQREKAELLIRRSSTPGIDYVFQDQLLILFTDDPDALNQSAIQQLKINDGDQWKNYLEIDDERFALPTSQNKSKLQK